jgi:hypothetical protein
MQAELFFTPKYCFALLKKSRASRNKLHPNLDQLTASDQNQRF